MGRPREQIEKLDKEAEEWLESSYNNVYIKQKVRKYFKAYLEFTGLTSNQLIEEKANQKLTRAAERRVLAFRPWFEKEYDKTDVIGYEATKYIRSFYSFYGPQLHFRKQELRRPEAKTKDYPLNVTHIDKMVAASNTRGKALLLFAESTGMRVGDLCRLQRAVIEPLLTNKDENGIVDLGDLSTQKERVKGHFLLHKSAVEALEKYLQSRTDDQPNLFITKGRTPLTRRLANVILKTAFHKVGFEEGQLIIRMHCIRKLWTRAAQDSNITSELWKAMIGKSIGGEATYSSENYLQAFKKMLPKLDPAHLVNNHVRVRQLENEIRELQLKYKKLERAKSLELLTIFGEEITRLRRELAESGVPVANTARSTFPEPLTLTGMEKLDLIALAKTIRRLYDLKANEDNHK